MKKINLRKGLRRIYRVILILAIIPSALSGYYGITYIVQKASYEKQDALESQDYKKLYAHAKKLDINWKLLDQHLHRDSTEKRKQLERLGSMGDAEFWPGLEVSMFGKSALDDAIKSEHCPAEIKDYLSQALKHNKTFGNHPSYFSFPHEDEFIIALLLAVTLILVPPLLYGAVFSILVPFAVWLGKGFVEENSEATSEAKLNDENS